MQQLWIVGAGGLGREVWSYAVHAIQAGTAPWALAGFVDDNPRAMAQFDPSLPVRGPILQTTPAPEDLFFIAIGEPSTKLRIAEILSRKGCSFGNIVHPASINLSNIALGVGCYIGAHSTIGADAAIGDHVTINCKARVGAGASLEDGVTLSGFVDIGDTAHLGVGAFVGSHAVVDAGITMGAFSKLFAGAWLKEELAHNMQAGGSPARIVPKL